MTRLLKEAIETLRNMPEEEQDAAADVLFAYISSDEREYRLRPDQAERQFAAHGGMSNPVKLPLQPTTRLPTQEERY